MRIYRFPDLKAAGVIFTRVHVDRLERRGDFPKRFNYGANSVAWVAEEVDSWVQDRIARRNGAEVVPLAKPSFLEQERMKAAPTEVSLGLSLPPANMSWITWGQVQNFLTDPAVGEGMKNMTTWWTERQTRTGAARSPARRKAARSRTPELTKGQPPAHPATAEEVHPAS